MCTFFYKFKKLRMDNVSTKNIVGRRGILTFFGTPLNEITNFPIHLPASNGFEHNAIDSLFESITPAAFEVPSLSTNLPEKTFPVPEVCVDLPESNSLFTTDNELNQMPDSPVYATLTSILTSKNSDDQAASVQATSEPTSNGEVPSLQVSDIPTFVPMDQKIYTERLGMLQNKKKTGLLTKKQYEKEKHKLRRELDQLYNCEFIF